MSTYTIPTVFTAVDHFSAPINKMGSAVHAFIKNNEVGAARMNRAWRSMMAPLSWINRQLNGLGIFLGFYGLFRLLKSGITTIADFEQAQVNLGSVMDKESIPFLTALSSQARIMALRFGAAAKSVLELNLELIKMGFKGGQVEQMTPGILTGATAARTAPSKMAETTGGILLAFKKDAIETTDVVNKLMFAANETAADFESFATQLPIVGNIANLAGVSYERTLAMLGVLRNYQVHTATGATSLKNIILDGLKHGVSLETSLTRVADHMKNKTSIVYAFDKFGKKSVVTAQILAQELRKINDLTTRIMNAPKDYTENLANKQLDTFWGKIKRIGTAWDEFVFSLDGNGAFAKVAKHVLDVVRAMILFAAGTDEAYMELMRVSPEIKKTAENWLGYLKVIGWMIGAFMTLNLVTKAFNVIMSAAKIVMLAFDAAALANPIGLITIGIAAFITVMAIAITYWKEFGAALLYVLGPLGELPLILMTIYKHMQNIYNAFKTDGFIAGIKAIGKAMLDFILLPLQQILNLLGSLPKWLGGGYAQKGSDAIKAFRVAHGMNVEDRPSNEEKQVEMLDVETKAQEIMSNHYQEVMRNMTLTFENAPAGTTFDNGAGKQTSLDPRVRSTMGF